jgi:flagellar basal-body rod protein FlgC
MSIESVLEAARAGLAYERLRMDAASRNIAASNVPVTAGEGARGWQVRAPSDFSRALLSDTRLTSTEVPVRTVHDPAHPLADGDGMVAYPAVDLVHEMTTLMTASRGYEANVRSFNLLRSMTLRALEIGSK